MALGQREIGDRRLTLAVIAIAASASRVGADATASSGTTTVTGAVTTSTTSGVTTSMEKSATRRGGAVNVAEGNSETSASLSRLSRLHSLPEGSAGVSTASNFGEQGDCPT
ncbi:hypothetical protein T484DRAFT_1753375 [Baffinella frigidus]|nr:hypothetical protein T484DRAFT_1753375 [Cryptophyta sp. CCMP2293]